MSKQTARWVGLGLIAMLGLSGCGDDLDEQRSLLERAQVRQGGPDPFLVVERRPLEIPPDLGALPPPRPGEISRTEIQPDLLVASALGSAPATSAAAPAAGEQQLLAALGAGSVPGDIRAQIAADHRATLNGADTGPLTRLMPGQFNPYRAQQLDPVEEVVRLRARYPDAVTPNAPLTDE
ncbi:DUF3035 domain-containing protein [Roseobacter sp. HKCCA0434]|uniref:DUF3035 domain-containing protein n=1 Tax=Roseobacter sp. HKCCA0434 TaxID=3079297 RepID=UPI002905E5A0|nr:DUF3035 domain-containing protein [Roseobacter sp. HKCCA0434]